MYATIRARLLEYTRLHLSTTSVARYVLRSAGCDGARTILFLSGDLYPDYLRCLTLHGLKRLLGRACHDSPRVSHMYSDYGGDFRGLYGKGFSYSGLLDPALHDPAVEAAEAAEAAGRAGGIVGRIAAHAFDVVVYGSYHRGMPHYDAVRSAYKPGEVILLCGEDAHACDYDRYVREGHYVFVRELE